MAILTVLPRKNEPNADGASAILRSIINEPVNVVLVILGRPPRFEKIFEVCVGRAEAAPNLRRVVHVPDTDVLEASLLNEMRGGRNNVVAVWGLNDQVAARLRSGEAKRKLDVERAFTTAEAARRSS